jgi:hypothetical protein
MIAVLSLPVVMLPLKMFSRSGKPISEMKGAGIESGSLSSASSRDKNLQNLIYGLFTGRRTAVIFPTRSKNLVIGERSKYSNARDYRFD